MKLFLSILYLTLLTPVFAEENKTSLSIYGNVGWSHYINNMVHNAGYPPVVELNFACPTIKITWEPEHRLSFGLETGFYRMYEIGYFKDEKDRYLVADCIPILFIINMNIGNNFYLGIGTGTAILQNKINAYSSAFSYTNYQFSISYRYPISKNLIIGGETHYIWIGKNNDSFITLQALLGYRLPL